MKTQEFFEAVRSGHYSDFDIYNHVQEMTDNFDEEKLNLLCNDFDVYISILYEEWLASFTDEEIEKKIHEWQKEDRELPYVGDKKPHFNLLHVDDFFKKERYGEPISDEKYEKFLNKAIGSRDDSESHKLLDTGRLFGGFYFSQENILLHKLKEILVKAKRKHTSATYKFEDKATKKLKRTLKKEIYKDFEKISFGEYSNIKQHEFIDKRAGGNIEKLEGLINDVEAFKSVLKFFGTDEITDSNFEHLDYFISKVKSRIDKLDKSNLSVNTNNSELNSNHINWLKSDETLEQFIEALQEQNLIKERDTEAIIKDHFEPVRGQNKEVEPIQWIFQYKNLLAYLIRELHNNRYIGCKNIWQEMEPHFAIDGEIVDGLRQCEDQYVNRSNTGKPSSHEIVDTILQHLPK